MSRDTYDPDFLNRVQACPGWPADTARLIRLWRTFPGQWGEADPDGEACARLENLHAAATGLIKAEAERRHVDAGPPAMWAILTDSAFIHFVMVDAVGKWKSNAMSAMGWPECTEATVLNADQRQALSRVDALVKHLEAVVRKESRQDNRAGRQALPPHGAAHDGEPFFKPKYFEQWNIGGELLRRNATNGKKYVEGKVRRIKKVPAGGTGKRAVYWYSEPDARKRWPDKFKVAEDEQARKASKPPPA